MKNRIAPVGAVKVSSLSPKGGGDRWVKMASAMDAALDRMRTLHATVNRMREVSQRDRVDVHNSTLTAVLSEIADVANILKTGLKAR